jgi:hypothetical protein
MRNSRVAHVNLHGPADLAWSAASNARAAERGDRRHPRSIAALVPGCMRTPIPGLIASGRADCAVTVPLRPSICQPSSPSSTTATSRRPGIEQALLGCQRARSSDRALALVVLFIPLGEELRCPCAQSLHRVGQLADACANWLIAIRYRSGRGASPCQEPALARKPSRGHAGKSSSNPAIAAGTGSN